MPLLAQLVVEYVADVSKLTSGIQAAGQAQDNMTSKANQGASALLGFAAGAAALATTAIVGIGVASTKMAADFQQGMTTLETGAGESSKNMKQVSDGILALAPATATTTKELTDGMYMIESAGFHGADGLNVLKNAAEGAKVGNAALKDVANGVTTAMTDYNLPVEEATVVTNDLVATVANGKTTMQQLSTSLKNILPVASSAGISLRDVSGAMSTMTGEGVPAGQSATYLSTAILALEAPSAKGADALKSVGLSAQDVSTKMKTSLPDALAMITDAVGKKFPVGSAAWTSSMKDITGGGTALKAMLDLTNSHMSTFKSNVDNIASSVNQGGSSITGWTKVQGDFNFQMDKGKEVVETMGIKLGTALLPKVGELLAKIMPVITQFGNWMISSHVLENAFTFLSNAIGGVVSVGINIVTFFQQNHAALAALQIALPIVAGLIGGALVFALYLAASAAWTAAAGFLAAAWPVILIGGAIAGLAAGFVWLYNNVKPFHDLIGQVGEIIQTKVWPVLQGIGGYIASIFAPVWQELVQVWQTELLPSFQLIWSSLQRLMPLFQAIGVVIGVLFVGALALLIGFLSGVARGLSIFIQGLAMVIGGVSQVLAGLIAVFSGVIAFIYDLFSGNFSKLGADLQNIWNGILSIGNGFGNAMIGLFVGVFGTIGGFVWGFVQGIIGFFINLYNVLVGHSIIPDMINGIINWFAQLPGRVGAFIMSLLTRAIALFNALWNAAIVIVSALINNVVSFFSQLPGKVMNFLSSLPGMISNLWNTIITDATNAGRNIVQGIANGITNAIGLVTTAITNVTSWISAHLPHSPAKVGPLMHLAEQGAEISNQIAKGMINGMPLLDTALDNITKPIGLSVKAASVATGSPTSLGANTNSATLQGGSGKQEVHVHVHTYWDGNDVSNRVMTKVQKQLQPRVKK